MLFSYACLMTTFCTRKGQEGEKRKKKKSDKTGNIIIVHGACIMITRRNRQVKEEIKDSSAWLKVSHLVFTSDELIAHGSHGVLVSSNPWATCKQAQTANNYRRLHLAHHLFTHFACSVCIIHWTRTTLDQHPHSLVHLVDLQFQNLATQVN